MESSITTTRLPAQLAGQRIELEADAHVAQPLVGRNEGAADVAVLDQALAIGDAALVGVADRGRDRRVGDGNDHVGLDRVLARQHAAQFHAHVVDQAAVQRAVGPCEVDVFKGAQGGLAAGKLVAGDAGSVDADQLAGRTSRSNVAPMVSSAHVSEATTQP